MELPGPRDRPTCVHQRVLQIEFRAFPFRSQTTGTRVANAFPLSARPLLHALPRPLLLLKCCLRCRCCSCCRRSKSSDRQRQRKKNDDVYVKTRYHAPRTGSVRKLVAPQGRSNLCPRVAEARCLAPPLSDRTRWENLNTSTCSAWSGGTTCVAVTEPIARATTVPFQVDLRSLHRTLLHTEPVLLLLLLLLPAGGIVGAMVSFCHVL